MICSVCGSKENLQEHHICYDPEEKITLCSKCHRKRHVGHGVGCARGKQTRIIKIPDNFRDDWKTMTYPQLEDKYNICFITIRSWANRLNLGKKKNMRSIRRYYPQVLIRKIEKEKSIVRSIFSDDDRAKIILASFW